MTFAQIPGLSEIKATLIQAVQQQHIAHAQLFVGKPGALNLQLALAYAMYLHCENKQPEGGCGQCAACTKSQKYIHPDTSFVFPLANLKGDKDEDRFKADILKSWRSFLIEQPFGDLNDWTSFYGGEDKAVSISREESREIVKALSLKPFESRYKIMIIWQPEYMHPSAANGILKILEEPPVNTFFILVSNATERLLPTILSRTQIIQVPLVSDGELEVFLKSQSDFPAGQIDEILQLAEGNVNLALKLKDQEVNHHFELFFNWMLHCYGRKYGELVTLAEEFHNFDKMNQRNLLAYSLSMLHETLLLASGAAAINRVKGGEQERVQKFSKIMDVKKIDRASTLINEATYFLERNGSAKMIFLDLSIQLSKMFNPL